MRALFLALLSIALLSPASVSARTWYILPDGSGDAPTIQAGVDSAASGDTILLAPGTYLENVSFRGKALILTSEAGPTSTVVDGSEQTAGPDSASVVRLFDVGHPGATIEGVTLSGGAGIGADYLGMGGGVFSLRSTVAMVSCVLRVNSGWMGGAVYCDASTISIEGCAFQHNTGYMGGAVLLDQSAGVICGSCFVENGEPLYGGSGGAISLNSGLSQVTLMECVFEGNTGSHFGGALDCQYSSFISVVDCAFADNAARRGGAISIYWSTPEIRRCSFFGNSASELGGAIYDAHTSPSSRIRCCTMAGNWAGMSGGAVAAHYYSSVSIDSCTIFGSTAPEGGGVFVDETSMISVATSIIAENAGAGIWCDQGVIVLNCNDVWGNAGNDYVGCDPGEGDFSEDPLFCAPEDLDFTLFDNSPCVHGHGCGRVGAWDVGCGSTATVPSTWGLVKGLFRMPGE